jgi:hypothetical protein
MRIIDLFALQVFAKILDRCNFRLLQQYRPKSGHPIVDGSHHVAVMPSAIGRLPFDR